VPLAHANVDPQPPQLLSSVSSSLQVPLHTLYPASHVNAHTPLVHSGCALATFVVHMFPHMPQLLVLLVVSTQFPSQSADPVAEHPDTVDVSEGAAESTGARVDPSPSSSPTDASLVGPKPGLKSSPASAAHATMRKAVRSKAPPLLKCVRLT
jgi:hypothetical protein